MNNMKHHKLPNMNRNTRNDKTIYYQHNIEDIEDVDLIQFERCFRKMKCSFCFLCKDYIVMNKISK